MIQIITRAWIRINDLMLFQNLQSYLHNLFWAVAPHFLDLSKKILELLKHAIGCFMRQAYSLNGYDVYCPHKSTEYSVLAFYF